jgi:large subunit ribosomal protein L18
MKSSNNIEKKLKLSIYRSNKHISVQLTDHFNSKTLISCSSSEKYFKQLFDNKNNSENAWVIGRVLAERSMREKIEDVVFNRNSYKYNGRVQALAEGARTGDLKF